MTVLLAALVVGAGAVLQSATGFGFALVAAPALVALVGPAAMVSALAMLALVVNGLTLAGEGRRPRPATTDAAALVAWALPGLAIGAFALATLPESALEAAVGAAVLGALAVRVATRVRGAAARAERTAHHRAAAGVLSGSLATSTGLGGPPLVLFLTGRSLDAARVRDTLAVLFLAQGALGLAALAFFDTLVLPEGMAILAAAAVAGQMAGRRAFAALRDADRFEPLVLGVLAVAGVAALVGGLF